MRLWRRAMWLAVYAACSAMVLLAAWARDEAEKKLKAPATKPEDG